MSRWSPMSVAVAFLLIATFVSLVAGAMVSRQSQYVQTDQIGHLSVREHTLRTTKRELEVEVAAIRDVQIDVKRDEAKARNDNRLLAEGLHVLEKKVKGAEQLESAVGTLRREYEELMKKVETYRNVKGK